MFSIFRVKNNTVHRQVFCTFKMSKIAQKRTVPVIRYSHFLRHHLQARLYLIEGPAVDLIEGPSLYIITGTRCSDDKKLVILRKKWKLTDFTLDSIY